MKTEPCALCGSYESPRILGKLNTTPVELVDRNAVQSVDTDEFRKLCDAYHSASQSELEDRYYAIVYHVDEEVHGMATSWGALKSAAPASVPQPAVPQATLNALPKWSYSQTMGVMVPNSPNQPNRKCYYLCSDVDAIVGPAVQDAPSDEQTESGEYIDCPACIGSEVRGEKRGVRCSKCKGSGVVAAPVSGEALDEAHLRELLLALKNAAFDCGIWDEENLDMPPYLSVLEKANLATKAVIDYVLSGEPK